MVKANELRVGNWVSVEKQGIIYNERILSISSYSGKFNTFEDEHFDRINTLKPIPITEEWLVKFGFEEVHLKNRHYSIIDKNGYKDSHKISIFPSINEQWHIAFSDTLFGYKDYIPTTKIKFVHQLQNLYFALTGEELETKGGNNE